MRDSAWYDAQYNNRALVPEHPALLARWTADSAAARAALGGQLDLCYGDGPNETLDVFSPASAGRAPAPVLVFIHGGYWRALDKSDMSLVAPAFCAAGVQVVVPNYALCPAVTVAEICVQMAKAVAWVWREAPTRGFDRQRIVVAGHSAGGHLTAMLMACRWQQLAADLPKVIPCGGVAISGLFDLEPIRRTTFLGPDLRLTPRNVGAVSPARFRPQPGQPPMAALVGGAESAEFNRQNRLIRSRWGAAAVPVCEALPGLNHFTVVDALLAPGGRAFDLALAMLKR
jgi:arylformamidase